MKKIFLSLGTLLILIILFLNLGGKPKIELGSDSLLVGYTIDDLIKKSEIIVIGEVDNKLPSQWLGGNQGDLKNASPEDIARARGLFTDSLISINQILKGDFKEPFVRVRSFIGETALVTWHNDSETDFIIQKSYLLFLKKDEGATATVNPGDYISLGAYQGVYEIIGNKAISRRDEWLLEDLIAYIQKVLSEPAETQNESITVETPISTVMPETITTETTPEIPLEDITPTP